MFNLWHKIKIHFSWKVVWLSDVWLYEENSITKVRRATRISKAYQPVEQTWLRGGKIIDRYYPSDLPSTPPSV